MSLVADLVELDEGRLADLATVGGEALVTRLLTRFQAQLSNLIPADAIATGGRGATVGLQARRDELHRTTGAAGLLGFDRLADLSRRLEDAADHDRDLVEAFHAAGRRALQIIARRLREGPPSPACEGRALQSPRRDLGSGDRTPSAPR